MVSNTQSIPSGAADHPEEQNPHPNCTCTVDGGPCSHQASQSPLQHFSPSFNSRRPSADSKNPSSATLPSTNPNSTTSSVSSLDLSKIFCFDFDLNTEVQIDYKSIHPITPSSSRTPSDPPILKTPSTPRTWQELELNEIRIISDADGDLEWVPGLESRELKNVLMNQFFAPDAPHDQDVGSNARNAEERIAEAIAVVRAEYTAWKENTSPPPAHSWSRTMEWRPMRANWRWKELLNPGALIDETILVFNRESDVDIRVWVEEHIWEYSVEVTEEQDSDGACAPYHPSWDPFEYKSFPEELDAALEIYFPGDEGTSTRWRFYNLLREMLAWEDRERPGPEEVYLADGDSGIQIERLWWRDGVRERERREF